MIRSHSIRGAALSGYMKASAEVGLNPYALLPKTGLQNECLNEPDQLIPYRSFLELLELSATASGHHDFGARAAIARGIPDLGAVSLLLREAETIEDALDTIVSKLHLHGDGPEISIDHQANESFIAFRIVGPPDVDTLQATEYCACGLVQVFRWLIGSNWKPQRVCFSHDTTGQTRFQRTFFQSPVSYDEGISGVLIDRQTLRRTVETSTPFLRRQAKRYLEGSLDFEPANFASTVSKVIAQMLPRDSCTADNVALTLGIDRRTLARRLEREGKSYAALLQQARCDIAQQIATDPRLSLTDAAEITGFQNLSSFSRWFRSTFGYSATQWRQGSGDTARGSELCPRSSSEKRWRHED
jgi:AraC-like DNA-binding protein